MVLMVPPCIYSRDQGERPVLLDMRKCDVNKIDLAPCPFRSDGFRPVKAAEIGHATQLATTDPARLRIGLTDLVWLILTWDLAIA